MKRTLAVIGTVAVLAACVAGLANADPGQSADLAVTMTSDQASYKVGDLITYTITVRNLGEAAVNEVGVADMLPAGLDLVSKTVTSTPDAAWNVSLNSAPVASGSLAGSTDTAGWTADGVGVNLGYNVGTDAGKTLVTADLGWLGSETYWSDGPSTTDTITVVARASKTGHFTNVVGVNSPTNPDPNVGANNFTLVGVDVTS